MMATDTSHFALRRALLVLAAIGLGCPGESPVGDPGLDATPSDVTLDSDAGDATSSDATPSDADSRDALLPDAPPLVSTCVRYTLAPGVVSAELPERVNFVDLAHLPSEAWAAFATSGIRARTLAGVDLPTDLVRRDPAAETGTLFFRGGLSPAGSEYLICANPELASLEITDPLGRNAVWRDYAAVSLLGPDAEERSGNAALGETGGALFDRTPRLSLVPETRFTFTEHEAHQGLAFDPATGVRFIIHTNRLYKYDADWNLVATNASPIGDSGIDANHLGDGAWHEGQLYIVLEDYPNDPYDNQHVVVFDGDLVFQRSFDISAQRHEVSSIVFSPRDRRFYVTDYTQPGNLQMYDEDFVYQGAKPLSEPLSRMQGITWWRDAFWVVHTDRMSRVDFDGTVSDEFVVGSGTVEGVSASEDVIYWLIDPSGAQNSYIEEYTRSGEGARVPANAARRFADSDYFELVDVASLTTFTMGVSVALERLGVGHQTLASYHASSAGSENTRVSLLHRSTGATGVWDPNNLWLDSSPPHRPAVGNFHTYATTFDGESARELFIDGRSRGMQTGVAAPAANLDHILVGAEDESLNETLSGIAGFVYLHSQVQPEAWHRALDANLYRPGEFYSLRAE